MSKNMTRKGLALGATLALATTGLVATPAFANSVVTSLASGTSFNSVVGYDNELRLSTVMSPGLSGNQTTLHYRVSNPSGAELEIGVGRSGQSSGAIALATSNAASDTAGIWGYQNAGAAYSSVDADGVRTNFQTALTDFVVVPTGNREGAAADENFITVSVIDATAVQNVTVTVTAWLDTAANASNVQDSVEVSGNTVTLNFFDPANVTASTSMVAPVTGANTVSAEVTTTPELNGQQLGTNFLNVDFTAQGNANAVLAQNTLDSNGQTAGSTTYNGTTKKWTATAYLNYSTGSDRWNGTNATVADVNLATTINSGTWFYHNSNTTAPGASVLFLSTDSTIANAKTHGLSAATGITHFVVFGTGVTNANVAPLAAASVSFASNSASSITFTDAKTATAAVSSGSGTAITQGTLRSLVAGTNSTVQASGVYSARPFIGTLALGAATPSTTSAVTADDTEAVIAGSANVEEAYDDSAASTGSAAADADYVLVRPGTSSVTITATIYYTDALDFNRIKKVPAGVPVVGTLTVGGGTFQVNSAGAGVLSNTVQTNANGEVTFTVTSSTAVNGNNVTIDIRPQSVAANNAAGAKFDLRWTTAAFTLYDMNTVQDQPSGANSIRHINSGGSYTYSFALLDQWGQPAASDTWRLQVVNAGRTVSSDTHTLTNGRVDVAVADRAQGSTTSIVTDVNVQRLVSGTWTTQDTESWDGTGLGEVVINVAAAGTETITLDANNGNLYQSTYNARSADLDDLVAAEKTVAQNRRTAAALKPAYANEVVINGRVTAATTGLAKGGTNVTITGDSNILFSYGKVDSFGSIVVPADADGDFTVGLFSNKAFDDTVITLTTANGASRTVKVDFGPAAARSGTTLTYTSTGGEPGRTLIITGLLTDKWGNPVDTEQDSATVAAASASATGLDATDARLLVTYTGPGLISGSMPVETGTDGTFTVRVLLGINDTGTATVSATYGRTNGSISAADTGTGIDLRQSVTVTIGKTASSTAGKVNVGSFNGKLVVYAQNLDGKRISWKVGGNWGKATAVGNTLNRFDRPTPRSGVTLNVEIFVDGVSTLKKSVVTR